MTVKSAAHGPHGHQTNQVELLYSKISCINNKSNHSSFPLSFSYCSPLKQLVMEVSSQHSHSSQWKVFGHVFPRAEIVYFSQIILIYIVVLTSLANLSLGRDPDTLWTSLLATSVGILLPQPHIKGTKKYVANSLAPSLDNASIEENDSTAA